METEHYSELLHELRTIWRDVSARHGGRVVRIQGDGALIVFGYPRSGEDDGRRAAEAALDIHERVEQLRHHGLPAARTRLKMHSGIHAGTVLLSTGDIERGRFELIGDVANTAAHLSRHAGAGEILASLDALGPHANFFELGDARAAPGLPRVRAVLARSPVTRRFEATARRGLTPFIGRSEIITSLRRFLSESDPTSARCALIVGGAGLGKTRLLEEVLERGDGLKVTVLRGSCESYLGAEILQPFLQMLRAFFGIQQNMAKDEGAAAARAARPPWFAELGPAAQSILGLVSAEGERSSGSGVLGDLLAFFAALSARTPLMLVIDDWQWADDASRQLLEMLLRLRDGPRVLLASRPRDDGASWISGAPHLSLDPFEGVETDAAVRRWLPQADPFLVARIHSYAGGVPLFIEELCHSVSADNLGQAMEGRTTQGWLATLVASRLARLPQDQAAVVRAAAVVGNVVPARLLTSACGCAPDQATIQALADADFLYPGPNGVLRFKHGITRDAVYDSIGLHERTALHQRVEAALREEQADRDDELEALAYHCRGGGHWAKASRYAERAGDKAMAAFALDRAREQYLAALETLDRVADRTRDDTLRWCLLANKLGLACIFDPLSLRNDVGIFGRAVALAASLGDVNAEARAAYWLGYMCYGFGRFREGAHHARRALSLAQGCGDHRLAAQIEAALGQILAAACAYPEAIALMDKAVSAKQQASRPGGGVAIGSAYTLSCKASVLADRGEFDNAHACFDEARRLLDGSTHPVANSVRNWISVALIWQGRWQEAEQLAVESARIAENTRSLLLLAACRAAAGFARWSASSDGDGLQQLRHAVQWMEGRRFQFYSSVQFSWLVEASAAVGDVATARRYAAHVLRRARDGERLGEAAACRAMARLAAERSDIAAGERWLQRAATSAALRASPREAALNAVVRAELSCRQGHAAAAAPMMAEAAAILQTIGMDWHAAAAARRLRSLPLRPEC